MLRRVDLVRTDFSEELSSSFIRVTIFGELGTTLAVTSNRRTLRRYGVVLLKEIIQLKYQLPSCYYINTDMPASSSD
jgi:hypothetical protein